MVRQRLTQIVDSLRIFESHSVPAEPLLKQLMSIIDLLDNRSPDANGDSWESLPSVMERTGLSRSYFAVPLSHLGERSRLDRWQESGMAKKVGTIWFLSSALELPKRHREATPDQQRPTEDRTEKERTYELMQSNRRKGSR
jgi:hypothetical protein